MDSILIQNPIIALMLVVAIMFQLFARFNEWSARICNVIGFIISMFVVLFLILLEASFQEIAIVLLIGIIMCIDGFRQEGGSSL